MKTRIGDVHMNYEISGNESRQWLVVLNGISGMKKCTEHQMKNFNKNYRVLNIDFSDKSAQVGSDKYGKIVAADLTRLLMDRLNVKNASMAGLTQDSEIYTYFCEMFPTVSLGKASAPAAKTWNLNDAISAFATRLLSPQLKIKFA
jgi:hypothetical protein